MKFMMYGAGKRGMRIINKWKGTKNIEIAGVFDQVKSGEIEGLRIDFARWLETLGIPWSGAIESVPRRATFFGKKVFTPDDFVGKDAAVLIAMNTKHTMEVLPVLKEKGIHNILEGFKIMERV